MASPLVRVRVRVRVRARVSGQGWGHSYGSPWQVTDTAVAEERRQQRGEGAVQPADAAEQQPVAERLRFVAQHLGDRHAYLARRNSLLRNVLEQSASEHSAPSAAGTRDSRGLATQLLALGTIGELEQEKQRESRSHGVGSRLRATGKRWRDEDFGPAWPTRSRSLRLLVCSRGLREAAVEPASSAKETHELLKASGVRLKRSKAGARARRLGSHSGVWMALKG